MLQGTLYKIKVVMICYVMWGKSHICSMYSTAKYISCTGVNMEHIDHMMPHHANDFAIITQNVTLNFGHIKAGCNIMQKDMDLEACAQ